jgi:hypothetical protein
MTEKTIIGKKLKELDKSELESLVGNIVVIESRKGKTIGEISRFAKDGTLIAYGKNIKETNLQTDEYYHEGRPNNKILLTYQLSNINQILEI